MQSWEWILINIKRNHFTIQFVEPEEAIRISKKLILSEESKDGKIYAMRGFKKYLKKRKRLTKKILKTLDEL